MIGQEQRMNGEDHPGFKRHVFAVPDERSFHKVVSLAMGKYPTFQGIAVTSQVFVVLFQNFGRFCSRLAKAGYVVLG